MEVDPYEKELWQQWRDTGDHSARDALVRRHAARVKVIAASTYSQRTTHDVPFEDFHQLALLGLLESIERFDPRRGVLFFTYAEKRIRGSILDGLPMLSERRQQWAMRKKVALRAATASRSVSMGTDAPIRESRTLDEAPFAALAFMLDGSGMIALSDEDQKLDWPFYAVQQLRERDERLLNEVKRLPDRERNLVWRHYLQQIPISDIAASDGISRGRASQIHQSALEKLRMTLTTRSG